MLFPLFLVLNSFWALPQRSGFYSQFTIFLEELMNINISLQVLALPITPDSYRDGIAVGFPLQPPKQKNTNQTMPLVQ